MQATKYTYTCNRLGRQREFSPHFLLIIISNGMECVSFEWALKRVRSIKFDTRSPPALYLTLATSVSSPYLRHMCRRRHVYYLEFGQKHRQEQRIREFETPKRQMFISEYFSLSLPIHVKLYSVKLEHLIQHQAKYYLLPLQQVRGFLGRTFPQTNRPRKQSNYTIPNGKSQISFKKVVIIPNHRRTFPLCAFRFYGRATPIIRIAFFAF